MKSHKRKARKKKAKKKGVVRKNEAGIESHRGHPRPYIPRARKS